MQSTPMLRGPAPSLDNLLSPIAASDTSTSGVSMSPRGSYSPYNTETAGSTFSLGTTVDSRVSPDDISTWIGKRNLSQPSHDKFDFSALLCPKQVSASYRVISEEIDKENQSDKGKSKARSKSGKRNKSENFDEDCEDRAANSSFSLDEVLAQYECDSRFSSNTSKSQSFVKKTKSLFDISGKKKTSGVGRSALSTLNLEDNSIPCDALRHVSRDNASRLSYVSGVSRDSVLSTHTVLSSDNLLAVEKSMGSEDYLESIRKTCTDMYSLQETSKRSNRSQKLEPRTSSRTAAAACQDKIRRRQSSLTPTGLGSQGNFSSQTLPRMFRTPLQNSSAHRNSGNFEQSSHVTESGNTGSIVNWSGADRSNRNHNEPNRSKQSSVDDHRKLPGQNTKNLTIAQNISKSSEESLSIHSQISFPKTSLSNKSTSHKDLSRRKGEWLCDSLNSLLSQEGAIESSLLDLRGDVVEQDEQLFMLQDEIDNILVKLKTILATV